MMDRKYYGVLTGLIVAGGLLLTLWLGMNGDVAARLLLAPGDPVLSPAANAYDVAQDAAVSITYDADISATTVTTRTFAVHAMQTGQILAGYSVNGGEIKVTPAQPFKPGELVQVSATTGTLGLDASAPLTPTVWQFWTRPLLGTACFSEVTQQLGYSLTLGLAVGDLNGDGRSDLVFVNYTDDANDVWLNQGGGVFTRTQVMPGDDSLAVALGDLDGDGDLDAFFANKSTANHVWLNDGTGVLSDTGQTLGGANNSYDVALGDVDGDGDLDAVVANRGGHNNYVWLNDGTGDFSSGQIFETRDSLGLALGDLDGDGDLDVFFANYPLLGNTVWLNDGSGTFVNTAQSLGAANSSEVKLGDMDADGDLDAVVANNGSSDVVWLNDGTGNFPLAWNFNSDTNSFGVALGDLDSDGDLDAFLVGEKQHSVWLNAGTGVLTDSMQELGDFHSYSAAVGDFNGDGALDLVSASRWDAEGTNNTPNYIWFNKLYPVLSPAANAYDVPRDATVSITYAEDISATTVTTRTFAVHAMQTGQVLEGYSVNGGEIKVTPAQPFKPGELVQVSATTGTLSLDASAPLTPTVWQFWTRPLLGTACFSEVTQQLGYSFTHGLAAGDLNGDGWLDLVFVNYTDDANDVWLNQGGGVFTRTQVMPGDSSLVVALGDLDSDGDLDAFFANKSTANRVWLNDGTGVLSDTGQMLGGANNSYDVALGDVDGDGDLDAVVANRGGHNNYVWLNDGTGDFSSGQIFETRHSLGLALGDLDGDGDLDVFFANYPSLGNTVWLNDGSGTFVNTLQSLGTANSSEVKLGDMDADGDLDAVVANNGSPDVVWLNDGAGSFSSWRNFNNSSSNSFGVALGDVDGDGDLDAFLVGEKRHSVWLNDSTGMLTDSMQELGDFYSYSAAMGDFNGDGALDLVSASRRDAEGADNTPNYIWFNQLYHVYLPLVIR